MKILEHREIDFARWDRAILNSASPLVFAQSFYLNATSPGWRALVAGDYNCLMPLTERKKLGISYLIQPPFTPQLGLFGECDGTGVFELLEKKYRYLSIELNASNEYDGGKKKRTFVLDLKQAASCNSNTKRNIGKALKAGLSCSRVPDRDGIKLSEKMLHPFLKKKLKIPNSQIKLFDALLRSASAGSFLHSYKVEEEGGRICALAYFISNGKHAVYLKGTTFDRNSGSMHFLMDRAISDFRKSKVRTFDFGGGQTDSLAQFYAGFGAEALYYKAITINHLPRAIRWIKA